MAHRWGRAPLQNSPVVQVGTVEYYPATLCSDSKRTKRYLAEYRRSFLLTQVRTLVPYREHRMGLHSSANVSTVVWRRFPGRSPDKPACQRFLQVNSPLFHRPSLFTAAIHLLYLTEFALRLFHTSDWHLGQNLHGQERDFEHACFLDWLLGQLKAEQPDALLIAGDIFDTVNPPLKAQERLYDFIISAHEQNPKLTIVMIAGNHDSGSRIELPAPLMRRLRTHALGRVLWLDDGQLDAERLLIPLPDAKGKIAAWCLALPFLRPAEVTGAHLGDDYLRGIGQVHEWLIAAANAKRKKGQALIAISHAHMAGGSVSEDSERSLIIGNAEALPASLFDASVSYVALGHL
ncbi:hypothetical protein ALP97_05001, partial [Pseudomonas salomonii]